MTDSWLSPSEWWVTLNRVLFRFETSHLYRTGWNTISCLNAQQTPNQYSYFVTRQKLQIETLHDQLPHDAIPFAKGKHLVTLK